MLVGMRMRFWQDNFLCAEILIQCLVYVRLCIWFHLKTGADFCLHQFKWAIWLHKPIPFSLEWWNFSVNFETFYNEPNFVKLLWECCSVTRECVISGIQVPAPFCVSLSVFDVEGHPPCMSCENCNTSLLNRQNALLFNYCVFLSSWYWPGNNVLILTIGDMAGMGGWGA